MSRHLVLSAALLALFAPFMSTANEDAVLMVGFSSLLGRDTLSFSLNAGIAAPDTVRDLDLTGTVIPVTLTGFEFSPSEGLSAIVLGTPVATWGRDASQASPEDEKSSKQHGSGWTWVLVGTAAAVGAVALISNGSDHEGNDREGECTDANTDPSSLGVIQNCNNFP